MRNSIIRVLIVPLFLPSPMARNLSSPSARLSDFPVMTLAVDPISAWIPGISLPTVWATLKLKEEHGVEVTMVDQDAPAGKAGIKEHDVILSINGTQVESVEQLRRMIREIPPGRVVTLGISRNGQPISFKAQLADRKKTFAWPPGNVHFRHAAIPPFRLCPPCRRCQSCPISMSGFGRGRAFFGPKRPDGGKPDSSTGRLFRREKRPGSPSAFGGKGQPRRKSRIPRR